jgi:hypothetical protein
MRIYKKVNGLLMVFMKIILAQIPKTVANGGAATKQLVIGYV